MEGCLQVFDESGESGCPFMFVFRADRGSVPFMDKIFYKKKTYRSWSSLTDLPVSSILEIRVLANTSGVISRYMFWLQRSRSKRPFVKSLANPSDERGVTYKVS